jgi:hypothetical protein
MDCIVRLFQRERERGGERERERGRERRMQLTHNYFPAFPGLWAVKARWLHPEQTAT